MAPDDSSEVAARSALPRSLHSAAWGLVALFLLILAAAVAVAYVSYEQYRISLVESRHKEVALLAEQKAQHLYTWTANLAAELEPLSRDPLLAQEVERWLARGARRDGSEREIVDELMVYVTARKYLALFLYDTSGEMRLAVTENARLPMTAVRDRVLHAVSLSRGVVSDFHRGDTARDRKIVFDYVIPLLRQQGDKARPVAALYLRIDPEITVYYLLKPEPVSGVLDEVLLIGRRGGRFVHLDDPKLRSEPWPAFEAPVTDAPTVAALAFEGPPRSFEGQDLAGSPVIGAVRAVPGTPWLVLARSSRAPLDEALAQRGRTTGALTAALAAVVAIALFLVWRKLRAETLLRHYQMIHEREALVRHFDYLTRYANDILLLADEAGRIVEANERAAAAYGCPRAELLGLPVAQLFAPLEAAAYSEGWLSPESDGRIFETVHQRRGGATFPAEVSVRSIEIEGRRYRQGIIRDITERHRMEQAMRDQLAFIHRLLDTIPSGVFYKDEQGRYLGCNKAFERYIGIPRDKLMGMTVYDVAPRELADKYYAADQALFDNPGVQVYEAQVKYADGSLHDILFSKATFNKANGELGGLVGVMLDISERKRAEAELKEREKRLAVLFERAGDIILVHDKAGRIVDVNRQACQSLGYERGELIGMTVPDIDLHCVPGRPEGPWSTLAEGRTVTVEGLHRRKDGSSFAVEVRVALIAPEPDALFMAVARDITRRKQAEEAVRDARDRLRALIRASPVAIMGLDLEGRVTMWNPAAERMFGWSEKEVLGQMNPIVPPDREAEFRALLGKACRGESFTGVELKRRRKDSSTIAVSLSVAPLSDERGSISGVIAVLADISGRREMEDALRASEQKFRSYIDNALDAVLVADETGRFLESNPAARALFGYSEEEFRRRSIPEVLDPDPENLEQGRQHFARVLDTGKSVGTVWNRRKDGTPMLLDINAVALGNNRFLGFLRDVTAQQLAAQQIRLYARVFESSQDAIIITNPRNEIIAVNRAFTDITGYGQDEVLGRNPKLLSSGRQDQGFYINLWTAIRETGHWQGELWNRRKSGEVYPEWVTISAVKDGRGSITNYIAIFSDISERKAAEEHISYLAQHDGLTGLPNRTLMQDRLKLALATANRAGDMVAVMFLDLDRFKTINDSLGHQLGDQLLIGVAERLGDSVRVSDTVSRVGGDEFVVILPTITEVEDVALVAEKIIRNVSRPYQIETHEINTTPSIGIAIFPNDGEDMGTLIKNADTAMYHAKESGRNNYQFFTQDMNARAFERLMMETRMRRAYERSEFLLYFQPQVGIAGGRLVGLEALIRWNHPDMGLVAPVKFIHVAEDSGLIVAIGEWVIREACRQNRAWQAAGLPAVPVAVNLSAIQFRNKGLLDAVERALRDSGLEACYLELELTESSVMQDPEVTSDVLGKLKAMGVKLAVDDFGTGYSSLNYLKRFPLDKLKVDQSFVRDILADPSDRAIVSAIVAMGHSLGLTVVAEGVEDREQLALLRAEGCDEYQGYLVSEPLPANEVQKLLEKEKRFTR
ncbi:MAG: PAS domain S-box protein [Betaproteobacteria bacterium]|nr:PAS domain S-box protein [Betaproteobacteria bacterium]